MEKSSTLRKLFKILLHAGHHSDDGYNLRRWFIFFLLYLAILVSLALLSLGYFRAEPNAFPSYAWLIALYVFYMSLCCTFFPAPTAWIVLLMASPVIGLDFLSTNNVYLDALLTIIIVAVLGAFGTAMANLNEYHLFSFIFRFGRIHKLRQTRFYLSATRWFEISPFALITVMSFLPIPVDVVRWLAISHRYRRDHYFLANFVGRFVRYALLAATATCLKISFFGIILIQASLALLILLRFLPRLTCRLKQGRLKGSVEPPHEVISA